ncbi:MAG: hypothetical protein DRN21_01270 [Thermoplasmata archaeon]|nr:MAG: hypothetical protein DRN21_01270 [Thermoplasmata archaeon]
MEDGRWWAIGHRLLYQRNEDKESKREMKTMENGEIRQVGPASKVIPKMEVAFVRRKGEYGMWWPGAIYDGEAALEKYTEGLLEAGRDMNVEINLRPDPLYNMEEAKQWVDQCQARKPDGLLLILLDRHQHAWPTAAMAMESGIPTVIFSPVGTAFTTNTAGLSRRKNSIIYSTDSFEQAVYGIKMIKAHRKLRETRLIVLEGSERRRSTLPQIGMDIRYVPAKTFIDAYQAMPFTDEIKAIAADYLKKATRVYGSTEQDVLNGVKGYAVARSILEQEEGDAITMDCLGALGTSEVSLPCLAWSRMNDQGVPAACEADLQASATQALVQYLFDQPGFQQDPVPETLRGNLIGAHCTCPTKLNGFSAPSEPFYLSFHHGKRDAVPRTMWKVGQRITVTQFVFGKDEDQPKLIVSSGQVVDNIAVPPSGGCVVSVEVALDGVGDCLAYPGFHQLFLYGDHKRELLDYCKLFDIEPWIV